MRNIPQMQKLRYWCQRIIPLVYDDSLSYLEVLAKVVSYLNQVVEANNDIIQTLELHDEELEELKQVTAYLSEQMDKIINGEAIDIYIDALAKWIDANLQELVARTVKFVVFGLSDDGYFVADVPETWEFITWDTDMSSNNGERSPLWGHLKMIW